MKADGTEFIVKTYLRIIYFFRLCLVGFLAFSLSGCASYAPAFLPADSVIPEDVRDAPVIKDESESIKVGDEIKIKTRNGQTHSGEVLRIFPDQIVIGKACNYGVCETAIGVEEIETLEIRYASQSTLVIAGVVGGVALMLAGFAALLSSSGGFGSN